MSWQPSKKLIAQGLYESGYLRVLFDPRGSGSIIPEHLRTAVQAAFDYGAGLPIPTDDTVIDDEGIQATLSFSQTPYFTRIPWSSVFCMLSPNHGTVAWPEDVPKAAVDDHMKRQEPVEPSVPETKPRPAWLKAVE